MGRFNFVSITIYLILAAAGYGAWKFGPIYYTAFQVDSVLGAACGSSYRAHRLGEPARSSAMREIEGDAKRGVHALDITDPALSVHLRIVGDIATATCDYTVIVEHPYIEKRTTLKMHREEKTSVKRVEW